VSRRLAIVILLALAALPARADTPSLWLVAGRTNTVYLFGSIHLLRPGEFEFAGGIAEAYADAERRWCEVDRDALSPAESAAVTAARAIDPDGRALQELLGGDAEQAGRSAEAIGIDLALLAPFEPWFAALSVTAMTLMRDGLSAEAGVEQRLQALAARDGKPTEGFETLDEQLAALDGMALDDQRRFLLQSIAEAGRSQASVATLVAAWRSGDDAALAAELEAEFADARGLYETLMIERNRRFVERIEMLLDDHDDHLVVVGALHLVGPDGLPAMLAGRGREVQRRGGSSDSSRAR